MARKSVLAYFAERANDDGSGVWASKQRIADEVECSKQTVIRTVKGLEADGLITAVGQRKTQGGYTVVYDISLPALNKLERAKTEIGEPEIELKQSHCDTTNQSHSVTGTKSDQSHSDNRTSNTVLPKPTKNRPIVLAKAKTTCGRDWPDVPDWMPVEAWNAFIEMRIDMKKKPTAYAVRNLIAKIDRWRGEGCDPATVLDNSTENNWPGIYRPKGMKNDNRNNSTRNAAQRALATIEGRSH